MSYVVLIRTPDDRFSFGDTLPESFTDLTRFPTRTAAIKSAVNAALFLDGNSKNIVQIVDVDSGKVLNVEVYEDDHRVVLVTHDATNGCSSGLPPLPI